MLEETNRRSISVTSFFSQKNREINRAGTQAIDFIGYLYNRRDMADLLAARGYPICKYTDAQLMLMLYEAFGKDCVRKAKGMFAFAVHDLKDGSLFLARDHAGGKPLYYAKTKNAFVFGPDLKGMLRERAVERRINRTALAQYLMLTYIPAPLTILEDVYKLPAGHCMTVSPEGETSLEAYWDVVYDESRKISDYETCKKQLREAMFQSVEACMYDEASTGVLLSGGIDSNIVAGIMSRISAKPIDAFSIGYKGVKDYDESDRAVISARFHNVNHHLHFIEYGNVAENIQHIIENIDEPFADASYIPTYTVSRIAGEHVSTILTGDAGDELFAGYDKYLIGHYTELYHKIPVPIRKGVIGPLAKALPPKRVITRKIMKVINNSEEDSYHQRRNMMCLGLGPDRIGRLLAYDAEGALDFIEDIYRKYEKTAGEVEQTLYTDFKVVLEGDMLVKSDRTGTLAGVCAKAPILHPDVVALAAQIPVPYKIRGKDRKIILKDTFSDLIPPQIMNAKKIGFGVPISYWFQNELRDDLLDTLDKDYLEEQGLLNPDYVNLLVEEHLSGKVNNMGILWALYIFEKWYRQYIEV